MTPAELFDRAGRSLFGEQYVAPMAALLDAEKNTVGKWRDGKSRIPPGVWGPIRRALLERGPEIERALLEIGNQGLGTAAVPSPSDTKVCPLCRQPAGLPGRFGSRDVCPDPFHGDGRIPDR